MKKNIFILLSIAVLWIKKIYSLPKLYFSLSSKRDITVQELRKLEKLGLKVGKLRLDCKYLETCCNLNICPEFLKFKPPNLKVYNSTKDLFQRVLNKKLNEVTRLQRWSLGRNFRDRDETRRGGCETETRPRLRAKISNQLRRDRDLNVPRPRRDTRLRVFTKFKQL